MTNMDPMHWSHMGYQDRGRHLARLDDAAVLRLARERGRRRKAGLQAVLMLWVLNGYLSRARAKRLYRLVWR